MSVRVRKSLVNGKDRRGQGDGAMHSRSPQEGVEFPWGFQQGSWACRSKPG